MKTGFISWQSELPPMSETELGQTFITAYETELWTFPVDTASWNHVASCRFGEGRPCVWSDATLWSGDSYRYDILSNRSRPGNTANTGIL